MQWDRSQYEKWREKRRHGAGYYVLVGFVLLRGGAVAGGMSAFSFALLPAADSMEVLGTHFVVWPLLGLFLGTYQWSSNEKKFRVYRLRNSSMPGRAERRKRSAS